MDGAKHRASRAERRDYIFPEDLKLPIIMQKSVKLPPATTTTHFW